MFNIGVLTNNARCSRTRLLKAQAVIWGVLLLGLATPSIPAESFPVLIRVDAARSPGELKPIWRFFGADEPNYAYMQHGRKLLGDARLEHFRLDEEHSNAFRSWQRMDSPQQPTPEQYAALRQAGQLATLGPPEMVRIENGASLLTSSLPRRGVSLLVLEWGHPPTN